MANQTSGDAYRKVLDIRTNMFYFATDEFLLSLQHHLLVAADEVKGELLRRAKMTLTATAALDEEP